MFGDADFYKVLRTTAMFTLLTVLPGVFGALALVLLMEARVRGLRIFRSGVRSAVRLLRGERLGGLRSALQPRGRHRQRLLAHAGVLPVGWLTDPKWVLISVAVVQIWLTLGYNVLVLSAGVAASRPTSSRRHG